jgi:hypothetical protein
LLRFVVHGIQGARNKNFLTALFTAMGFPSLAPLSFPSFNLRFELTFYRFNISFGATAAATVLVATGTMPATWFLHATLESRVFEELGWVIDALIGLLQKLDIASFWIRSWGKNSSWRSTATIA